MELCGDCHRRSRNCPFCQSLNREISLEKKRHNTLILNAIRINVDPITEKKLLYVTYPLKCDPKVAYSPDKSNNDQARQNSAPEIRVVR